MKYPIKEGTKVFHGSPGYENKEVISCVTFHYCAMRGHMYEIAFENGCFTYLPQEDFQTLTQDGEVQFNRGSGFRAIESIFVDKSA